MFLLQHFFFLFLFLLFTSLISFSFTVNSGKQGSQPSTSHVIHLHSDLLSHIYRRLTPDTLSRFPKEDFTKEDLRICLENWLVYLKRWNGDEFANVEGANKMAQDFDLTGDTKDASLELSDLDNTQPAPWAWGLSIILLKAVMQLSLYHKLTAWMPWIFIPDGQAFHFILVYWKASKEMSAKSSISFTPEFPACVKVLKQLISKPDISLIKDKDVRLGAAYVRHNRDVAPKKKSQVNDLTEYEKYVGNLNTVLYELTYYPWLMNYVEFGKTALEQLLLISEIQLDIVMKYRWGEYVKKFERLKAWLKGQLTSGSK